MHCSLDENRIDGAIRFFLYVLIFWLPYSPAVVESCVVISIILWVLKRGIIAKKQQKLSGAFHERLLGYLKCFQPVPSPINKPIAVFLAVCLVSVANSVLFEQSLHNFLTKTLEWFIVYFLVIEVLLTRKHLTVLICVLIFTALATAFDGIVQFHFTHKDIFLGHVIEPGGRATAGFKTSNGLGAYLTLLIPFVISLIFLKEKNLRYRLLISLIILFMMWSLVVTFSRGAWLGAFLGIIFLPLVFVFHRQQRKYYFVLGLVLVTAVLYIFFGLILMKSFDLEALLRNQTIQWRLDIWQDSIKMIKDRPFFGHGINTFMQLFQSYRKVFLTNPTYAHNCYIQLAAETGIFGLFSFLWIIGSLFRESFKKMAFFATEDSQSMILTSGLLSGIFAFLIHSFFDTHFYSLQLSVYLWFMIGVLVAVYNVQRSEGKGAY